ncbi:MAG: VWA domain-containing protein [Candidatus Sulfotelmatobacter sp.]|jgi:VWFA-related protein
MRYCTRLGFLLGVLLVSGYALAQAAGSAAHINAPGGNPRDLPVSPTVHHASEEGRVVFRSQTVLIQVPVVVTDKAGAHIHGLPKEQFRIFEDGKEQKIASFEEVVANNTPLAPSPAPAPGVFSNLAIPTGQPRSVTVIAIDLVNTPFLDQAYGRQQLIKYLGDNLDSGQEIALVLFAGNGVKVLQGLTTDGSALISTLKTLGGQQPALQGVSQNSQRELSAFSSPLQGPGVTASASLSLRAFIDGGPDIARAIQQDAILATMEAFRTIAEALSGIPGRKTLIWATSGFPFAMNSPDSSPVNLPLQSQSYERTVAALNQAQVSVYPVDVRGLVALGPTRGSTGPVLATSVLVKEQALQSTIDTMQNFAETTGGRAFYNRNDVATGFRRAADDASSYYLIEYYLDTHNNKAGWKNLKVKVAQRDVQVRAREGFLMTSATMNPDTVRDADLKFVMNSPFDATGIPLTVRLRPAAGGGENSDKKAVGFTLQIAGKELTTMGSDSEIDVDVMAIARSGTLIADNVAKNMKGKIPPEKLVRFKSENVDYPGSFHLPSGNYELRFVVRDNQSGRMGSVTAPVTVD